MSLLHLSHIKKSYEQGSSSVEVLHNIDLELEHGKTVAVVGQSGSGKSTLLSVLCGLEEPDAGSYLFDGVNFLDLSQEEKTNLRACSIGIIFQQFHLLPHMTALENVMLVLEVLGKKTKEALTIASHMLDSVGLSHRLSHFPAQLSGGEKQRVAMARAMVIKPKLILADEPSGSLDQDTGDDIMNLIFELVEQNNTGLILVTHNNTLAKRCERTLSLSRGTFSLLDS